MSLTLREMRPPRARFPRVSGDEPQDIAAIRAYVSFSPRERG